MSEIAPRPPYRIPIEADYEAAAEIVDALLQTQGGPWNYYHRTALIEGSTKQTTRDRLAALSFHARLVEPIEDDHFTPIDPLYRATHAFRAGMWTAGLMTEELHRNCLNFVGIHTVMAHSLPHGTISNQEEHEENGRYLIALGDEGLKRVGYVARERLNRWGEEIVSEENVRRYYTLGAGAILYASHRLYSEVYKDMQTSYEAQVLAEELSRFLANTPDSSDN